VSRRSRRSRPEAARAPEPAASGTQPQAAPGRETAPRDPSRPGRPPQKLSLAAQIGILAATFGITVGLAELFGAANLGTSFGIGQITFAIVLVILLVRA
jgi:hypothetical protein